MSLIDKVERVWKKLDPHWKDYLELAGLDVRGGSSLAEKLSTPIKIDFSLPGLQDLARETCRGIEPGDPARSLLYHVLASPNVPPPEVDGLAAFPKKVGTVLSGLNALNAGLYPTLRDIEVIENYVYGVSPPSLEELRVRAGTDRLGIAVFAVEYMPAYDTVHRRHADLCFSRTGISRVGTCKPNYNSRARGFLPNAVQGTDTGDVSVVPCRFAPFIAAQVKGNPKTIGPAPFNDGDEKLLFWIPLQKLFDGECIRGIEVQKVELSSGHVNEKLKRIQLALRTGGQEIDFAVSDLEFEPFRITEQLAEFSKDPGHCAGLLVPEAHKPMTAPAKRKNGQYVTFHVPPVPSLYVATMQFSDDKDARHSPEFVHIRHTVKQVGRKQEIVPVTGKPGDPLEDKIKAGNYDAVHFVDYTADGWVKAHVPELAMETSDCIPAYSIVAQPDFFPLVTQEDLMDWWQNSAPVEIKGNIWPSGANPNSLAITRLPANLNLRDQSSFSPNIFDPLDTTVTTIVSMLRSGDEAQTTLRRFDLKRESTLSIRATNVFQPGWDTSQDRTNGVMHLAAYGLGSPFPEDAMLCAALGSYWPAAVPDTARLFPPSAYSVNVTPMLDNEMGWDGVRSPQEMSENRIAFTRMSAVDYVARVWNQDGKQPLNFGRFFELQLDEYVARTLVMARVFQILKANTVDDRAGWGLLHFTKVDDDVSVPSSVILQGKYQYRLVMFRRTATVDKSRAKAEVKYEALETFYACATRIFKQLEDKKYQGYRF